MPLFMVHDCFADEVAIDFPSVDPVVERMRDAFLGERTDDGCIKADLLLSSREAWDGLVVPVEVPMHGTCPECGGRGETWTERCGPCGTAPPRARASFASPCRRASSRARPPRVCPDAPSVRVELRGGKSNNELHSTGNR
jgi:hypothetical protein